jgi:6,7-dimethyl-8-ribityllumazine synthase
MPDHFPVAATASQPDLSALRGQPVRVAIVVSRYNSLVTQGLLGGCIGALAEATDGMGQAEVHWVPGAFEIPQTTARLLRLNAKDKSWPLRGIVTLGCLIEGETDHYRVLADEVTRRMGELSVASEIPLAFGVLTCRTAEQALARSMPGPLNKGAEAMRTALELALLQ